MCFWLHWPTGAVSQHFASLAEALMAPGPWQPGHPLHQPGWQLIDAGCELWQVVVALQPQPYWTSQRTQYGNGPVLVVAGPVRVMPWGGTGGEVKQASSGPRACRLTRSAPHTTPVRVCRGLCAGFHHPTLHTLACPTPAPCSPGKDFCEAHATPPARRAGKCVLAPAELMPIEVFEDQLQVNLVGALRLTQVGAVLGRPPAARNSA
jgi:hypothetical protein